MPHPATRLLAVLELLQAHGRMSGPELAARLDVDPRTVRRYVTRLEEMGIPITAEQGRHGAYMLVAGFKLPPMMFTDEEALALSLGLLAARGLGLADAAPAIASARAKLERVLPETLRSRARAVDETVQLDLAVASRPSGAGTLATLAAAARERRRVHLGYRSARCETSERDFDAYGLAHRGGEWYVVGWCHLRGGVRSFRVDRITSLEVGKAVFERPSSFDPLGHLTLSLATLPRRHRVEVLLRTDLEVARRWLFATVGTLEPVSGGLLLTGQADDLDWFARELARLPFPFEIRGPAALRQALRRRGEWLVANASGE